jgi:hypothetical protein
MYLILLNLSPVFVFAHSFDCLLIVFKEYLCPRWFLSFIFTPSLFLISLVVHLNLLEILFYCWSACFHIQKSLSSLPNFSPTPLKAHCFGFQILSKLLISATAHSVSQFSTALLREAWLEFWLTWCWFVLAWHSEEEGLQLGLKCYLMPSLFLMSWQPKAWVWQVTQSICPSKPLQTYCYFHWTAMMGFGGEILYLNQSFFAAPNWIWVHSLAMDIFDVCLKCRQLHFWLLHWSFE